MLEKMPSQLNQTKQNQNGKIKKITLATVKSFVKKNQKRQATKRPWIVSDNKFEITEIDNDSIICATDFIDIPKKIYKANARLIVKAVNCHDELVEALKGVVRAIEYLNGTTKHSILYNNAKQALSKTESES